MKYPTYNQKGEEAGEMNLPKDIFEIKVNPDLIYQVVVSQQANRRKVIAHTKDRSKVSGGGRKPWRQKGTGRARHGSTRSPIWRGGGVTFGPTKERIFNKRIPKKMRRKALFMVLTAKAKSNLILVLDKLEIEKPKTKTMLQLIESLRKKIKNFEKGNLLIALPKNNQKIILASRNLKGTELIETRNLNALDLLSFKYLLLSKEAIENIKETFLGKKKKK